MTATRTALSPVHADSPNVALIHRLYAAFAAHDFDALPELLAPDVEITQSTDLPWGGTFRGLDGAVAFFGGLLAHIATVVDVGLLIDAGDHVVEVGRTRGSAHASGRPLDVDEVHVYAIRDGRVGAMQAYVHHPAMLAALSAQ